MSRAGPESLEADVALVPQVHYVAEPEADRAEVAAAHRAASARLLEMFPKAKFVHIVRDPYVIFPSTVNLWKRSTGTKACRCRPMPGSGGARLRTLTRMYEAFDRDRDLIGRGQFCEVRYEELVADPVGDAARSTSDWN